MEKKKMSPKSLENLEKGRFKKGEVSNPKGKPKNNNRVPAIRERLMGAEAAKEYQGISREEYFSWLETVVAVSVDTLKAVIADEAVPVFAKAYARAIVADMNAGRTTTVDKIMDRINSRSDKNRAGGDGVQLAFDGGSKGASEAVHKRIQYKKTYIVRLLKKQGKYTPELSIQAEDVAVLLVRKEILAERIFSDAHKPVNVEISREGNERESVSPIEKLYLDYQQHSQRALRALGMNTDSKERKPEGDGLAEALSQFR